MTVIGSALLIGVLACAGILVYVLFRSRVPDSKMRFLSTLMRQPSSKRPVHRHVHA